MTYEELKAKMDDCHYIYDETLATVLFVALQLAGKAAVFKIKLHEVKYKELPALDDELAKDCSEYDTLDEFKASIRKNNQEQLDKQDDLAVENALVDQVIESMEGEIPQAMYDARMDEMVNDFAFRVEQQGLRLEDYLIESVFFPRRMSKSKLSNDLGSFNGSLLKRSSVEIFASFFLSLK